MTKPPRTPLRIAIWTFLAVAMLGTVVGATVVVATTERDYGRPTQRLEQGTVVGVAVGVVGVAAAGAAYAIQRRRHARRDASLDRATT